MFMTDEALSQFAQAPDGSRVDGNIALTEIGAGGRVDTTTMKERSWRLCWRQGTDGRRLSEGLKADEDKAVN